MNYIRNNKVLLIIIAALLLVNIGLLYFKVWKKVDAHKSTSVRRPQGGISSLLEKEVGFSKEQLAQYDQLRNKHFESLKPYFDDVRIAKDSLYRLISREQVHDSVIELYAEQVSENQKAVELKMFNYLKTIAALCTPEQRPKYDSLVQRLVKHQPGGRKGGMKGKSK